MTVDLAAYTTNLCVYPNPEASENTKSLVTSQYKAARLGICDQTLPPQRINYHEYESIKGSLGRRSIFEGLKLCQSWKKRLIREETSGEDENRQWYQNIGCGKQDRGRQ